MKLSERAFMIDLIKKNFRRRMAVYMFGSILLIFCAAELFFSLITFSGPNWYVFTGCLIGIWRAGMFTLPP